MFSFCATQKNGIADGTSKTAVSRNPSRHGYPGGLETGIVGMVACRGGNHNRCMVFPRRGSSDFRRRDWTYVAGPLKEEITFTREE